MLPSKTSLKFISFLSGEVVQSLKHTRAHLNAYMSTSALGYYSHLHNTMQIDSYFPVLPARTSEYSVSSWKIAKKEHQKYKSSALSMSICVCIYMDVFVDVCTSHIL